MKKTIAVCLLAVAGAFVAWFAARRGDAVATTAQPNAHETAKSARPPKAKPNPPPAVRQTQNAASENAPSDDAPPASAADAKEDEENRLVDAFDALTDKWTEPRKDGVAMADVAKFCEQFRKVPPARRDECIHRALNLVPDENVMLLAGILMDPGADKEVREAVFNDVLNRDESVKKPIMQQIYKDRKHPCWADVAWILDVTGETPKSK